jgi:hypothetical protein
MENTYGLWTMQNTYPGPRGTAALDTRFGCVICEAGQANIGPTQTTTVRIREEIPIESEFSTLDKKSSGS